MQKRCSSDKKPVDELTKEFLVESRECLERMERCLPALETCPDDADLLAEIFRAVHTIKGATGFLALPRMEKLAHVGEHLLGLLRDGSVKATPPVIDVLLDLLDGLRHILDLIEATDCEGTRSGDEDAALIATIVAQSPDDEYEHLATGNETRGTAPSMDRRAGERHGRGISEQTLRVTTETLNRMMNQVGELVLTRNQMLDAHVECELFQQLVRRLDGVTADLQATVMHARTQPVEQLFQKFPRLVRDLARQCGRSVRLEFSGEETRLDKGLLEALKDPITHAVRNAVDHGIEPVAERVKRGKEPEGVVRLRACYEGGQVVIEVTDDGCGIDTDAVVMRAVERSLITAERACSMNEKDAMGLIFLPGLSTRDAVTTVSGRGVGMDVVRANIESVGGVVEMESKAGEGSVLRMRVPLTLAIIPALMARCGGESFVLPRNVVNELAVVHRSEEAERTLMTGDTKMFRWRNKLVPLVVLADLLDMPRDDANGYYVAVVEGKGRCFGLVVDALFDSQEVVVKPLSRLLRQSGIFSGGSILGNGELALILDIAGIAERAQIEIEDTVMANQGTGIPVENFSMEIA
jgi:two-component system chemotaxis sensor kinase CheA